MIILTGSVGEPKWATMFEAHAMGMLLGPGSWRRPWCRYWACDNDVFAHRDDPAWWWQEGEARWLRMLEKIHALPRWNAPLFVLLPDVVGDWDGTIERARRYRHHANLYGLTVAVALQDGCDGEAQYREVDRLDVPAVFVGGSKAWKWTHAERLRERFWDQWFHIGRVNGPRRIREALRIGADSVDGTGFARHSDEMMPPLIRILTGTEPQLALTI